MLKKIIQYVFVVPALLLTACSGENKIAVVDLQLIYNSFDYQKELSAEYEALKVSYQYLSDSLDRAIGAREFEIKNATTISDLDKNILFERDYVQYLDTKERLAFRQDSVGADYTSRIWKQLNSYMADFGVENNYDLVIGMQGDGTVMYAREGINITEDAITYVNKKYNGE